MSDELSIREDGTREMVYVHRNAGDVPWHTYGKPIPEGLTLPEAIKLAQLDWPVVKAQVKWHDEDGNLWPFPDRFVTYRGDRSIGLGIVGSDYHVVQNLEAFRAAEDVARRRGAPIETMGALYGGRHVWALFFLGNGWELGGEPHKKFLFAYTSHDGSTKVRFKPTVVRVVCRNTASAALGESGRELSFAHTDRFDEEIKAAEGIFDAADDVFEAYKKRALEMQGITVAPPVADTAIETFAKRAMWNGATREELERALVGDLILDSVVRATERKNVRFREAVDLIHARLDEEREGSREITAWLLTQSMTGWVDHERSSAKGERRFSSLLLGTGDKLKQTAFEVVQNAVTAQATA